MNELTDIIHSLPTMKSGEELLAAMRVLPKYDESVCSADIPTRLMALSDLYRIYVPNQMSAEIYSKMYLALLRSLQKKLTKQAVRQQNQNFRAIMRQEYSGICNSKNGKSFVGVLTQLINNSGISICMVGTPESTVFFEQAMPLARRSLGLQYDVMGFGDAFRAFCDILYSYQYVRNKSALSETVVSWLYEHSGGNISVVVSFIHDAQEISILNGKEVLNIEALNEAYQQRLSLLHGFIKAGSKKQSVNTKKKTVNVPKKEERIGVTDDFCIADLVAKAKAEGADIVQLLKEHITVVEVAV